MNSGRLDDGTPWVAIGSDEPEAREFIIHSECESCGKEHYFDLWSLLRGEEIVCEHCGHRSKAKRQKLVDGEWVEE